LVEGVVRKKGRLFCASHSLYRKNGGVNNKKETIAIFE